jgi:hypothetical protein
LGLEKDDEDAEHILILDKIEAFQELEIRMVDYLGETKFVARRNWWQNLTSRFLLMFFLPMFGAPPAGQIIYWDPENRPSGKYAPWTEGNPGRPAARLGQDNGGVEAPVATEAATQVLDRKPWKWIKYLLPWF